MVFLLRLRVLVRKLASPFGHPTQVSTQVQLAATCHYLRVGLAWAYHSRLSKLQAWHITRYFQFTWQLSNSQTGLSPQRKVSDNSYTPPEKTNSKESLSASVLSQGSKKPLQGTPRTSTPEPRKSTTPPVGQQPIRGFHHESILSKVESHADRRKPFYVSMWLLQKDQIRNLGMGLKVALNGD